jgi:hypothetical protein
MWRYISNVGVFMIMSMGDSYGLYIEDKLLRSYECPISAAHDVYKCSTGHKPWDTQNTVIEPVDLTCWEKVNS